VKTIGTVIGLKASRPRSYNGSGAVAGQALLAGSTLAKDPGGAHGAAAHTITSRVCTIVLLLVLLATVAMTMSATVAAVVSVSVDVAAAWAMSASLAKAVTVLVTVSVAVVGETEAAFVAVAAASGGSTLGSTLWFKPELGMSAMLLLLLPMPTVDMNAA
jgi:hypothetical protein